MFDRSLLRILEGRIANQLFETDAKNARNALEPGTAQSSLILSTLELRQATLVDVSLNRETVL